MEGYKPWLTYMNSLYNDGTVLNNEGGSAWSYGVYCGGDYVSAYTMCRITCGVRNRRSER